MADGIVRDSHGRYVKGHSGNPQGRSIDQYKYLKKMEAAVSAEEWIAIIRKAVEQAKRGDPRAREWLSDYLMGKPLQTMDITSGGDRIVDERQANRALSALAIAIGACIPGESTTQDGAVDAAEQTAMASPADKGR